MAGKVLNYVLTYRNGNGEETSREICISFVSNFITKEYTRLIGIAAEVSMYNDRLGAIASEYTALEIERPNGYKTRIEELKKERSAVTAKIMVHSNGEFLKERFKLVKEVLIMNGYHADNEFCSDEFWDRYTDASVIWDFLTKCVGKDSQEDTSKKKDPR